MKTTRLVEKPVIACDAEGCSEVMDPPRTPDRHTGNVLPELTPFGWFDGWIYLGERLSGDGEMPGAYGEHHLCPKHALQAFARAARAVTFRGKE